MAKRNKYPHLKELFHTDWNGYLREYRKMNPLPVKDPRKQIVQNIFDELPEDAIAVDGFPTYYARPNGEVYRDTREVESAIKRGKARVLKLTPTYNSHNGYWIIQPYKDGKKLAVHLHRFILTAFKGPAPDSTMECHHIDHNTSNNAVDNLMWVTRQQNADFVPNHKRRVTKTTIETGRKLSESKWTHLYPQIAYLAESGMRPVDIADMFGIPDNSIYQIIKSAQRRNK